MINIYIFINEFIFEKKLISIINYRNSYFNKNQFR